MALSQKIGFLGFGNMGQAIGNGLITAGEIGYDQLVLYDLFADKLGTYAENGSILVESSGELAELSDVLVLATKPQDMGAALEGIGTEHSGNTLYISIAAGLSIAYYQGYLGESARIIRVMPNTPALVNAGAAGYAMSEGCSDGDEALVRTIFESIGIGVSVPESSIDAVTAISGSGPAYYFYFVECMVNVGVELGLSKDVATDLAVQTLYGAGKMLRETGEPAETLRAKVTSKGGTTFAALESFQDDDLAGLLARGVRAAATRSQELGK